MIFLTGVYTLWCWCISNPSPSHKCASMQQITTPFSETVSWNSSVNIVTLYRVEGLVMEFQWEWDFLCCPHRPHALPRQLYNGYWVFIGEKRPECHAGHPPPASARLWMVGAIPLPPLRASTDLYLLYISLGLKTSDDAFRLSYSIAFDCSIRPFLDLFHSWLYMFHLSRFSRDDLVFSFLQVSSES